MIKKRILLVATVALLAACGGTTSTTDTAQAKSGGKPSVQVVDSGFGQDGPYVRAVVIATTDSKASVGESVTASVNFLDAKGELLGTETQVEAFKWVGQELALPVSFDLSDSDPKAKVAKIDVDTTISDYGSSEQPKAPLANIDAKEVKKGEYGGTTATFEFTNESTEPLKSPRIGIACYDAAGKIIGGTSEYPDLVAPGKTIRIDADVTTSGLPKTCKAFPSYDVI